MEQRISFITLGVADLSRSRAFYEAMGWVAARSGEGLGVVFFQAGGMVLALFPHEELAHDAGVENTPASTFRGVSIAHNTRTEAEADAVMAQAVTAGGRATKPMGKVFWGGYSGYFADPDGHLWEVCFNPFARLADDGALYIDG